MAEAATVLMVPAKSSWEVPAYLYYSTLSYERPPQAHVAALRWLHERFGAELVGVEDRVLEVIPRRRPTAPKEAVEAADKIVAYSHCPITSENEIASVPELALYLMASEYWTFCWP